MNPRNIWLRTAVVDSKLYIGFYFTIHFSVFSAGTSVRKSVQAFNAATPIYNQ